MQAEAERLPRLSAHLEGGPASQAVLARIEAELTETGAVGQPWEVTKEWPKLQDCETSMETSFKLCGKLTDGVRKLYTTASRRWPTR